MLLIQTNFKCWDRQSLEKDNASDETLWKMNPTEG